MKIPATFDELIELRESGTLTREIFSSLIKLHWEETGDELDECSFCQGDDIWEVLSDEDTFERIVAALKTL